MMKRNWEYKKLGEVCTIVGRIGFRGYKRSDYVEGLNDGAISLSPSNINNGVLDYSKCTFISWEKYKESPEIMIENGDVLLVKTASVGKSAYVEHLPHETTINPQFVVLKHISANHKYIAYVVKSNSFLLDLKSITFGSSVPTLSQKDLADLSIPVPPLDEQSRIVAELDLLTGIIDKQNAQLKELDNLAQAIFYDMFGDPIENPKKWPVKKLGELSSLITNGNTPKGGEQVYVDKGILFLRSQNVWKNYIDYDDVAYIDDATNAILKKSVLHHNDILITKTGRINTENSSLGRSALFDGETGTANINGHVYLVRLLKGISHIFVLRILISKAYREYIRKVCVGGIDKRQINKDHVEDFPIIVPPLALQQSFAEKIQSIEKQKETIRASIADTQKLLDYTMDKYFG